MKNKNSIYFILLTVLMSIQAACFFHYTDRSYYRNLSVNNQMSLDSTIELRHLSIKLLEVLALPASIELRLEISNSTNQIKKIAVSSTIMPSLKDRKYSVANIGGSSIKGYPAKGIILETPPRLQGDTIEVGANSTLKTFLYYKLDSPFTYTEFKEAYLNDSLHLDFCCDENNKVIKARMTGDKFRYVKKMWDK